MYPRLRQQLATALGTSESLKKLLKIHQKSTKNRSKIDRKSIKIGSWAPRGPKRPQGSPKTPPSSKNRSWSTSLPAGFWEAFRAMLALKATKRRLKMHTKFRSILMPTFFPIFRRFWKGFGVQVGFKIHPKPLQEPFKSHSKWHLVSACFWDRFFVDFSSIFGRFWTSPTSTD